MKLLLTGDLHLRGSNPENRIDDFFKTQLRKVEHIFSIAKQKECLYILCPGDVFDNPRPSFDVLEYYIKLFKRYNIGNKENRNIIFSTVWGQHDQRFRTKDRTALRLMESLGFVDIVTHNDYKDVHIYGCNYGDEIPQIDDKDNFNILLIHKTIIDKPIWSGQEDYLQSDKLMHKYPYDVIVSGDWHHPVFYQNKEQTIINCGCLVRKTTNEADLTPHVYILDINEDTFKYTLEKIVIPFEPAEIVFKKEALGRDTQKNNEKLNEFINSIKNNAMNKNLDFRKNLDTLMLQVEQPVKDLILKELEAINE